MFSLGIKLSIELLLSFYIIYCSKTKNKHYVAVYIGNLYNIVAFIWIHWAGVPPFRSDSNEPLWALNCKGHFTMIAGQLGLLSFTYWSCSTRLASHCLAKLGRLVFQMIDRRNPDVAKNTLNQSWIWNNISNSKLDFRASPVQSHREIINILRGS